MWKTAGTYTLAAGALAALAACSDSESETRERTERPVQIVPHQVSHVTDTTRIEAVGTARARKSATIYPETGGEVVEVGFEAGDHVGDGDLLIQLEAREERLAVQQAQVALKDAQRLIDRYSKVDLPGAISGNEMDRAEAAYDAAEIQLDIARNALAERSVRAPFAGHVGLTDIDSGARITTDTVITRLDDREILYVDFSAPEQTFGRLQPGEVIQVEPFSAAGQMYDAEILTIDSAIDAATRAYTVRAAIDNSDDRLRPGMSFRIGFDLPGDDYPSVPEASIVWGGDGAYLWAVENGRATRVPVTIISREKGQVLVKADIPEGSWIIEEGVQKVRQGTPVETPGRSQAIAGPDGSQEGGPTAALP